MRPQDAALQASAAPLRVQARLAGAGPLGVRLLKRRGPAHDAERVLATASSRLVPLLQHRRVLPDRPEEVVHAVLDRPAARARLPQRLGLAGR